MSFVYHPRTALACRCPMTAEQVAEMSAAPTHTSRSPGLFTEHLPCTFKALEEDVHVTVHECLKQLKAGITSC
jgi:hypothetical protein